MNILILGGGSVKGSWQAGALKALAETGYRPDAIVGISVGSLNGTFLAEVMGRGLSFKDAVSALEDLWLNHITKPEVIVSRRKPLELVWRFLLGKDPAIASVRPLEALVKGVVSLENLRNCKVPVWVGCVNLYTGDIEYHTQDEDLFLDYVIASSSIPLIMPVKEVMGVPYLDGGLRQSAGVKFALKQFGNKKSNKIDLITPHAGRLKAKEFNADNTMRLADRVMDIISVDNIGDDVTILDLSRCPYRVVRPKRQLEISIGSFDRNDILTNFEKGYKTARKIYEEESYNN